MHTTSSRGQGRRLPASLICGLVLSTNDADPHAVPGFTTLPAVQTGAVATLDHAAVVGLNTPSPLSIPYSLDLIRPALEAAASA